MSTTTSGLRQRPWFVVAILLTVLVVAAVAAQADPGPLGEVYKTLTPTPPTGTPSEPSGPMITQLGTPPVLQQDSGRSAPAWLGDVLRLLLVVVIALVVGRFLQLLLGNLKGKRIQKAAVEGREAGLDIPFVPEEEVVESFAATLARLRAGHDVDDSVIECWRGLVASAEASGITRAASQTAEEFTVAVMSRSQADPTDLAVLADLYRSAMFSTHHAGEPERQRAIACLQNLHQALAEVVPETAPIATPATPSASSAAPTSSPKPSPTWDRWGES